ncbi:uncharacterized protein LOC133712961 [Rosa rugosa]|uniref:uncharacterized protein LOC133712961 n=1 Tax=Rosa rugosa TaxID=74645 RepID=UPI002B412980|nr:uncharacterized protein LOC133712961 [Rosa rugosa]
MLLLKLKSWFLLFSFYSSCFVSILVLYGQFVFIFKPFNSLQQILNPRQQHLWLEILLKLSSHVQRLQQLWEEKLLNNPHEHQYPKKRLRLFCWVAASDVLWSLNNGGLYSGQRSHHFKHLA